jgi:hypothetical protein
MTMKARSRCGVTLVALVTAVSAAAVRTAPQTQIAVQGRTNANPSVAASGQFAALTWSAATAAGVTDIFSSTSRDGGRTFGAPVRVNRVAGEANISGEQPPRVALIPRAAGDPTTVIVWTAKGAEGTRLMSARSTDGGQSFLPPAPVSGSDSPGNRGWQSIATTRDGDIAAIWLDHREVPSRGSSTAHAGHQHGASHATQADGVARAQLSKLFFGRLSSSNSARALTGGVCYCCKTAVATGSDGSIHVAWRHVYPGNIRDIAFTMSADGGRTFSPPVRVSEDRWVLDGCPENGPAIAVGAERGIHLVWPTLVPGTTPASEPTLGLFYSTSRDGKTFTTRQRIPTEGVPRHPQITLGPRGDIVVAWDEQTRGGRRIALARSAMQSGGTVRFLRQVISAGDSGVYPAAATAPDGIVLAWTSGPAGHSVIRTERLAF